MFFFPLQRALLEDRGAPRIPLRPPAARLEPGAAHGGGHGPRSGPHTGSPGGDLIQPGTAGSRAAPGAQDMPVTSSPKPRDAPLPLEPACLAGHSHLPRARRSPTPPAGWGAQRKPRCLPQTVPLSVTTGPRWSQNSDAVQGTGIAASVCLPGASPGERGCGHRRSPAGWRREGGGGCKGDTQVGRKWGGGRGGREGAGVKGGKEGREGRAGAGGGEKKLGRTAPHTCTRFSFRLCPRAAPRHLPRHQPAPLKTGPAPALASPRSRSLPAPLTTAPRG